MANLVTVDSRAHRDLRVSRQASPQVAHVDAVSVVPREFQRLVAHYPIFFTKSSASGLFEPAALLGFQKKENLFLVEGRWDVAYAPASAAEPPPDLAAALDANPKAAAFFATLTGANRYAILYRIGAVKTPAARACKIRQFVAMLERGETIHG